MSEFRGLEIRILSTQRIPGLRGRFTSEILLEKGIYFKKISRCAGNLFIVILSTQRIPGGDLVENHCFIQVKLANVDFWILIGGRCERKWRFSKRETTFGGYKKVYEDNFSEHCKCWWYRVALTRSKRSGRSIWKMKHVLNILAFNTCFNGSDVDENRHFIQGEVVAHRQILFLISIYEWKSYSKMKNLPNLLSFGTEGLP